MTEEYLEKLGTEQPKNNLDDGTTDSDNECFENFDFDYDNENMQITKEIEEETPQPKLSTTGTELPQTKLIITTR